MSKPSRRKARSRARPSAAESDPDQQRRIPQRHRRRRRAPPASARDPGRDAQIQQRRGGIFPAGGAERGQAARRRRAANPGSRGWPSANVTVSTMNFWCDSQLMPSRQIAAAIDGWRTRGARLLQRLEQRQRALVADLAERQRRIVLERTVELGGDVEQRFDRIQRLDSRPALRLLHCGRNPGRAAPVRSSAAGRAGSSP